MEQKERIEALVSQLNKASEEYYSGHEEIMTNFEWDASFDELTALERETGYILPDSPTQTTSHAREDAADGQKEPHEYPALSLAKTKQVADLQAWAETRKVWLSWKLDGLTLVLTYDDGKLTRILTRGNGSIGTNITYMAPAIKGVPLTISYTGHLVVRGEATISYQDFEAINDTLEDEDEKYANPRNLAAGTLALDKVNLDKVRERNVTLNAFTLVHLDEPLISWGERMNWLDKQGFITVEREMGTADALPEMVERWTAKVEDGTMGIPVDGLVLCFDDTEYAATGSVTGHHATLGGLAFKWQDVSAITELDHIEWSCAASAITPVAVFRPVQLEGTTVSRASLCNISELERLGMGESGTSIEVIKANKIIPKVVAVKAAKGHFSVPEQCPVCGEKTAVSISASGTKVLRCTNKECPAKHLKRFTRFVSKTGMDIDGLSIQTLLAFVNMGFVAEYSDIFHLAGHAGEIREMEGFGEKSCENLLAAIEKSRKVNPANFLFALCIPLIGVDAAKKMLAKLGTQGLIDRMMAGEGFEDVDGIGPEKSGAIVDWMSQPENHAQFEALLNEVTLERVEPRAEDAGGSCNGLTFVITGDVHIYKNRAQLKAYIEEQGGAVTGSVSKKTNYLINNDVTSTSSKNTKAKSLGIPILSEEDFVARFT